MKNIKNENIRSNSRNAVTRIDSFYSSSISSFSFILVFTLHLYIHHSLYSSLSIRCQKRAKYKNLNHINCIKKGKRLFCIFPLKFSYFLLNTSLNVFSQFSDMSRKSSFFNTFNCGISFIFIVVAPSLMPI